MEYGHIAELSHQLYRGLALSEARCWIVLDPALRPILPDSPLASALAGRSIVKLPKIAGVDPTLMPLLVEFDQNRASDHELVWSCLEEALRELSPETLALGGGRRICGWLQSAGDGKTLASHMVALMVQAVGTRRRLLRWHDPAVLWALWPLLNTAQRDALLGPILKLWLLDPRGCWETCTNSGTAQDQAMALDQRQWQQIECIGALNRLLREENFNQPPTILRDAAMSALLKAKRLGFDDPEDQVAFARLALHVHPAFADHPWVAERLAKRQPGEYFAALVADLTPEHWASIRHDAGSPMP